LWPYGWTFLKVRLGLLHRSRKRERKNRKIEALLGKLRDGIKRY